MIGRNVRSRRAMMLLVAIVLPVAAMVAAGLLGWLGPRMGWRDATGWSDIPETDRPVAADTVSADEPWIRWLGHSGFVIEWHGTTILLDPNLSGRCTVSRRIMEIPPSLGALDDAHVLISHAHYDHLNQDTLVALPGLSSIHLPAGSEVFLDRITDPGVRIVPVHKGVTITVGSLEVTPVEAAHNGNRFHPLRSRFEAVGYMIRSPDGVTLYYAGDTAYDLDWESLRDRFHPDLAILPIGAYAPRIPLKFHHLNPEEAVLAAGRLGVRKLIPCHFGTFTLSFDRPHAALPRFARAMQDASFPWEMPRFLEAGELDVMLVSRTGP